MAIVVPITGKEPAKSDTNESYLLMAAAEMHRMDRLIEPVPLPKERPTSGAEEAAKAAIEIGEWGQKYSAEGRRKSTEVEHVPELKGPITFQQFGDQYTPERHWRSRIQTPMARAIGADDIPEGERVKLGDMMSAASRRRRR